MTGVPDGLDRESSTNAPPGVRVTESSIKLANRWDHLIARWGINRMGHRIEPGLYALGRPSATSDVFVTASYTLSFDALRSALSGTDAWILVLDTKGVNVWCAAAKGTFGTDELVRQVEATGLRRLVTHRVLIVPQLGAAGVAAHEVVQRCGFRVEYGPVRAADLPEYLRTRRASPEMRRVRFTLADRLVLIPVEMVHASLGTLVAAAVLFLVGGWRTAMAVVTSALAGTVLFPILLPWLPTTDFSTKGFGLGLPVAVPFAWQTFVTHSHLAGWVRAVYALPYLLMMTSGVSYFALNFTGSTPFTSRSGVRREIFTYVPVMAWLFGAGAVITAALALLRGIGVL